MVLPQLKFTKLNPLLLLFSQTVRSVGRTTGECVRSEKTGNNVCQIEGWCPTEDETLPLVNKTPIFSEIENWTVLIKNTIRFPVFNILRRNIDENKQTKEGTPGKQFDLRFSAFKRKKLTVFLGKQN